MFLNIHHSTIDLTFKKQKNINQIFFTQKKKTLDQIALYQIKLN